MTGTITSSSITLHYRIFYRNREINIINNGDRLIIIIITDNEDLDVVELDCFLVTKPVSGITGNVLIDVNFFFDESTNHDIIIRDCNIEIWKSKDRDETANKDLNPICQRKMFVCILI